MITKKTSTFFIIVGALIFCSVSAFCADILDTNGTNESNQTVLPFEKRFVYFDRSIDDDDNYNLLKKVIVDAERLGFNGLVLNQEYIYARLSHKNPIIDAVKVRLLEAETMAHAHGLELVVMHFNAEVPTFVVKDGDPDNSFYKEGKFDFSEANRADTKYLVKGDSAFVDTNKSIVTSAGLLDGLYHFKDIKPNTEYKLTVTLSTKNFQEKVLKVSVLDEDYAGENGKVLFGVQKYFRGIGPNVTERNYSVYFNSLNHKNLNGAIKVFVAKKEGVTIKSLTLQEVGYTKSEHVVRDENRPQLISADTNTTYKEGRDYRLEDEKITLLTPEIKQEKSLILTWYPKIDVSRFYDHETMADICADEELYHSIMRDQYQRIKSIMGGRVEGIAFNDDEWREAGWNAKCQELYKKEFTELNSSRTFTGGDYIGISTKRMIENLLKDENSSKISMYVMSDMFDPNFNAKDPYMGVNNGAIGAIEYLPKETIVFNWFPNPYEPGLEDKTDSDFLKSAKHFSDYGIRQIIAGYHDDMRNLDANIDFYKDSDAEVQKSIIGFMFLIWNQPGKNPSYDDMQKVVKRLCEDLPGKWDEAACKALKK
jgi:hypothetical protein